MSKVNDNLNLSNTKYTFLPDCTYNKDLNEKLMRELIDKISTNSGMVKKNEIIIGENEIITNEKKQILDSYKAAFIGQVSNSYSHIGAYFAYFILIFIIIGVLIYYIANARKEVYSNNKSIFFLMMWILLFTYAVHILDPLGERFVYAIPFIIAPIVMINFFDKKLALYHHIIIIFIASLVTRYNFEFIITQILVGMIAIQLFAELRFWNKFFRNILYVFLSYVFIYSSLKIVNHGSLAAIDWTVIIAFIFNSILILIAYPLIPLLEKPFGYTSKITLTEFGDFNKPLLKELSYKAPGTFQHSIQVGIIAEAATEAIRGNALLVKIGALYHDIGKTYAPQYFIENQRPEDDPYKDLDNITSAQKIIDHVKIGKQIAIKNGLPKVLQRFIVTHHGTTKVEFFYRKELNENPDNIDESKFRYSGPKPVSKEESILMIADSLEATAKCLVKPTEKDIDNLVENIIELKIKDKQLEDSLLSFKELVIVKKTLKKILLHIHHSRIDYPTVEKP
ncbi:MAG: HDIG domain-containing protein [Saprospiraceae bacterium]